MITEILEGVKGNLQSLNNSDHNGMHYLVMTLDEFGRPLVLKRVITNMSHIPHDLHTKDNGINVHYVPVEIGDAYSVAFIEEFLGDQQYWIEIVPVAGANYSNYKSLAYAWADDSSAVFIHLPETLGWQPLDRICGLKVKASLKTPKRLKELVRVSRYYGHLDLDSVSIEIVEPCGDDGAYPEYYDGQSIVSIEFLMRLARTKKDREYIRKHVHQGSLRVLGPFGLIKGDFIVGRDMDVDIITHRVNVKSELKLEDNGLWCSFFEHHDHHVPVTDIQTLSWLKDTVFPIDEMVAALNDLGDTVKEQLAEGVFPSYMKAFMETGEHDYEDVGTIKDLRAMYNRWTDAGRSLDESAYFIHTIGSGFINMMRAGMRFPIPWATYGHVTTHELLEWAGYGDDVQGREETVFYHTPTGRISFPGRLFKALFNNHGGWDADDSVRILIRLFGTKIKGLVLRSPNAYGEYSIVDVDVESFTDALYHVEGEIPILPTVKEFKALVPPIQVVDKMVTYSGMPGSSANLGGEYTPDIALELIEAMKESPGVGRWANSQMVFYSSQDTFRSRQLARTEDIVDTLTQSANREGFKAIEKDVKDTWWEIIRAGNSIERYFLVKDKRVPKWVMKHQPQSFDGYLTKAWGQHNLFLTTFADEVREISNTRRTVIAELLDIEVDAPSMKRAKNAEVWYRGLANKAPGGRGFVFQESNDVFDGASRLLMQRASSEFWRKANRKMVKTILNADDPSMIVAAMYQYTVQLQGYGRDNGIDRMLFAPNFNGEASVMDLLLAVMRDNGLTSKENIS